MTGVISDGKDGGEAGSKMVTEMMENMDEYTIPARYNPVINHYMAQGDFGYLSFDGERFSLPMDKIKVFYLDLKEKLPKGERIRKVLLKAGSRWSEWSASAGDEEAMDLKVVDHELTPERMEAIILEEEDLVLPDPGDEEGTWKDVAFGIGVILFILFLLLIFVGLVMIGGDLPLPPGGGGGLFSSKGKKTGARQ
ncbi:MAG: hypothetical protein ACMUHY_05985 [Thermoplasmatota archaeon]